MTHHHILHLLKLIRVRSKTATLEYERNNLWGERIINQDLMVSPNSSEPLEMRKSSCEAWGWPSLGEKASLTPCWIHVVSAFL